MHRFWSELCAQFRAPTSFKKLLIPSMGEHVHEIHTAGIRDFDRRYLPKKQ